MKKGILCLFLVFLLTFTASSGLAHSGRTDANGGHYNRKTGEYHYHNGGKSSASSSSNSSSTSKPAVPKSKVTVFDMPKEMVAGDRLTITWILENSNTVEWTTSDSNKLMIDKNGVICAYRPGKVSITAKMDKGSKKFNITVKPIRVESLKINPEYSIFMPDAKHQFSATILPANSSEQGIKWKSSNPKVATLDADGNLIIKGIGKATITASAKDNSKIKDAIDIYIGEPAESISIEGPDTAMGGEKITFEAIILPENATDKTVKWEIEPKSAGKISAKGVLSLKNTKVPIEIIVRAITNDVGLVAEQTVQVLPTSKKK